MSVVAGGQLPGKGASAGPAQRILIAGCGDVGSALAVMLQAAGHDVHGLRRRVEHLPPAITPVAADLVSGAGLQQLKGHFDTVVYAAAASERTEAGYRAVYVDGPARLARALSPAGSARWLLVSSTAVYGQCDGERIDEDTPPAPRRFNGRLLVEAEARQRERQRDTVVVRFGGIYGPGRRRLIDAVRRGEPCIESPPQYSNRIHRDDCAGVLAHLLTLAAPRTLYLGVDCDPAPIHEVMDYLATRLRCPPVPRTARAARAAGSKRASNARLLGSGYRFRYPSYREGYGELLDAAAAGTG